MYQVPQNGGEARVVPLGFDFVPDCADEYSAYDFDYTYPDSHNNGVRLDLAPVNAHRWRCPIRPRASTLWAQSVFCCGV